MARDNNPAESDKDTLSDKILRMRIVKALIAALVITIFSYVIIGFNLSTNSGIQINDNVNRYFDTCVGEGFVDSTPRINIEERGLPLAYWQSSHVPICENGVELKRVSSSHFDIGSFGANILFWTCVVFVLMRTYVRRKHIKITRND